MQINFKAFNIAETTDCLILPVYQDKTLTGIASEVDNANNNILSHLQASNDLTGKYGELKWLYNISENIKSVLTVGVGNLNKLTGNKYIDLLNITINSLTNKSYQTVVNTLADVELLQDATTNQNQKHPAQSLDWKVKQIILTTEKYSNQVKTYQEQPCPSINIESYYITSSNTELANSEQVINNTQILASAIKTAKDLANMPPNICNPGYFRQRSEELATKHSSLSCQVLSHDELEEMGMGAFCSVSQGSNHPGCMIVLEHKGSGNKNEQPYVLIGKGITFDTGGYTLKPPKSMLGMKYDMSGAASVYATMQAVAELNLPINVIGILACAENMIGHKSTRPNDIIKSLSGKSIEINNTDAEGRLVLCDALTYSEKFKPKVVIDVATLTGAAVMALGYQYTAVYTNEDKLQRDLINAANDSHDLIWPMPLCNDYNELLDNPFADLQNSSSMPVAGSITAACFLANFVPKDTTWAHLDIAGSATVKSNHTEATGRPVPLLLNYLLKQV